MIQLTGFTKSAAKTDIEHANKALKVLLNRQDLGFFRPLENDQLWQQTLSHGKSLRDKYRHLVVVGTGGSALGARAIISALGTNDVSVSFLDNVDGMAVSRLFSSIEQLASVHWLFVSKSGGTLETLALLDLIAQRLASQGLRLHDHSTVISENIENPLANWATKYGVVKIEMPRNVGGRYSVLTPVGMLPAAFAGHDILEFRKGAVWVLADAQELVVQLTAQSMASFARREWISVFWIYSSLLSECGRWIQQLWAESLAKSKDRKGGHGPQVSVPLPLIGSVDQHSVLQQLSEGVEKKFVWFIRLAEAETFGAAMQPGHFTERTQLAGQPIGLLLQAFAESTKQALNETGVESLTLVVKKLDEKSLGSFFMLLMLVVASLGEVLEVNAFDQPGVELGKRLVAKYL